MTNAKLQKLKEKWEKILEKEGLGDIEKHGYLRTYHDQKLKSHAQFDNAYGYAGAIRPDHGDVARENSTFNPIKNAAKEAYYQLAGEFLHEHRFESEKERKIWELHSLGMPSRQIAKTLREPLNYSRINRQIVRLRKLMLSKTSLP